MCLSLVCAVGCSTTAPSAAQPTLAPADEPTPAQTLEPVPTSLDVAAQPAPADTVVPPTLLPTAPAQPTPAPTVPPGTPTPDANAAMSQLASCDPSAPPPAPLPGPSGPRTDFFRSFRDSLPPAPLYDPPGPKRVGLQAGHWLTNQVPAELRGLGGGAVGGGREEWQVNLDVAERTADLLEATGLQVDVLPTTVPEHYQANVFVALHADGDTTGQTRGFKVARPGFSSVPSFDDKLVDLIDQVYGAETELPRDDEHISLRMRYYYAFNSRRYCHAVVPGVPQAIIEMAYLTNATDRQFLIGDSQKLAQALADSIQAFLATTP